MSRLPILCLCALIYLSACVPMMPTPVIEPKDASFLGIGSLLLDKSSSRPLTVIWVHGMCSHFDDWADGRAESLKTLLSGKLGDAKNLPIPDTAFYLRRRELMSHDKVASLNFVLWSQPSIVRKSERLCFDDEYRWIYGRQRVKDLQLVCKDEKEDRYFPYERASLNGLIKATIMNDCLADAVYYAGVNGKGMRKAMRAALCVALSNGDQGNADCSKPLADMNIALVSQSLGSKVLFDAVVCADSLSGTKAEAELSQRQVRALTAALSQVTHFYMLANQLPILDLADQPGQCPDAREAPVNAAAASQASTSTLMRFIQSIKAERAKAPLRQQADFGELVIVAFTDPNDLLSYRLTDADVPKERGSATAGVRIVNVFGSNLGALLGFVERPDKAHTGYAANPDVSRLLICGTLASAAKGTCD